MALMGVLISHGGAGGVAPLREGPVGLRGTEIGAGEQLAPGRVVGNRRDVVLECSDRFGQPPLGEIGAAENLVRFRALW